GPLSFVSALMPRSEPLERALRTVRLRDSLRRFAETLALFPDAEVNRLLLDGCPTPRSEEALQSLLHAAGHLDVLARFLYLDARFGLADDLLLYTDKISMASSLEVRVPFLDLDLLKLVESIPSGLRVRLLRPKLFLKKAFTGLLPPTILNRPKRNFAPPEN